jgi:hypothetical protein
MESGYAKVIVFIKELQKELMTLDLTGGPNKIVNG